MQFRLNITRSCKISVPHITRIAISFQPFFRSVAFQVYINKSLNPYRVDGIKHSFTALSEKFGHQKAFEDVFEMFGEFEKGQHDVMFDVSLNRKQAK
jgi:hypothetical protein